MSDRERTETEELIRKAQEASDQFVKLLEEHRRYAEEPPRPADYATICREYARRDFWTLKEGFNLLARCRPQKQGWEYGIREMWDLAKSCIGPGGSLDVSNPETAGKRFSAFNKLKIRPANLLSWAGEKGFAVPQELEDAVNGARGVTIVQVAQESLPRPRIEAANATRKSQKERRRDALRSFLDEMDRLANKEGLNWNRECIPVTKTDFHKVFYQVHPEIPSVAVSTLADDLPEFGTKFAHGTKKRRNNVLHQIFLKTKLG